MRTATIGLVLSALFWLPALAGPLKQQWIELSHPFNNDTIYWHTVLKFKHTEVFKGFTDRGYFYSSYDISGSEHGGTHLDAPNHFAKGKWTTDEIPIDRLTGHAIKIDISSKAAQSPDAQLMPSDLEAWEKKHGMIPDDVILLIYTNWGRYWPDKKKYLGTDTDDVSMLHFPGIHVDASRWLVKNRNIKLVGIDTASIDYGQSKMFESHQTLYEENIPGLENIANMDQLPVKGFTVYAAPMFISGGSGGPCRVFALLDCA